MVRIKERYLLVNILFPEAPSPTTSQVPSFVALHRPTSDALTVPALLRGIRAEISALFGEYGAGVVDSDFSVKYFSRATSTFILRVSRSHYRLVWAALTFMRRVPVPDGQPCIFRVVHVSGTIRKVERETIRRARHLVIAAQDDALARSTEALQSKFGAGPSSLAKGEGAPTLMDVVDESGADDDDMSLASADSG